jgi:hypothetical protein
MRILILLSLLFSIPASAASVDEDVQRYIAIFNGDKSEHSANGEALGWAGLSDPRLFDLVEQRLLKDYPAPADNKAEKQRIAWYIRALGFSGDAKYLPTINRFLAYRDTAVYSKHALVDMPDYKRWNPVISERASFDPKMSDYENRVGNMLRSNDFSLKRLGAKRIFYDGLHEERLLDVLAEELRAGYPKANVDKNSDPVAWMVRALGASRKEKYKPLIQEVIAKATVPAVQTHAKRALDTYTQR